MKRTALQNAPISIVIFTLVCILRLDAQTKGGKENPVTGNDNTKGNPLTQNDSTNAVITNDSAKENPISGNDCANEKPFAGDNGAIEAPAPLYPIPTGRQLSWQELEYCGFIHFNINTYTDREWGYGDEPESLFNPSEFDAEEIAETAERAGMKGLIVTAKHHDGFCLWPSKFTEHSVKNSPWRSGKGDIIRELADACRRHSLRFGIYLSPWDRNHKDYGKPEYLKYYRSQLRELLTEYGDIFEVWFDGANGGDGYYGGTRETRNIDRSSYYGWEETWQTVRDLQPDAVIFSDVGPDIRWVGNESGYAGETCWSMYTPAGADGSAPSPGNTKYAEAIEGHSNGKKWLPAECDVSIRPGWFYHESEDTLVKSPEALFDIYLRSVGRNASLLLNIPPDRRGRFHTNDINSLIGFRKIVDSVFARNLALNATATASSVRGDGRRYGPANLIDGKTDTYWTTDDSVKSAIIEIDFGKEKTVSYIVLQEHIPLGQRVEEFDISGYDGKSWTKLVSGTTIGYKRILEFPRTAVSKIRLEILKSRAAPLISNLQVY